MRSRNSFSGSTYRKPIGEVERISPMLRKQLRAQLDKQPGADAFTLDADVARRLLLSQEPPETEDGASIRDEDWRVTYRVTIGQTEGRNWLRTVEVIPDDDDPDPRVFRIPDRILADHAAHVLAIKAESENPETTHVLNVEQPGEQPEKPSAEELLDLLRAGNTRQQIAEQYDRRLNTVHQWFREARRDHPELDWPQRKRGPKPKGDGTP